MTDAGVFVFTGMPLIFAFYIALGFTDNNGISVIAVVVTYCIIVKN